MNLFSTGPEHDRVSRGSESLVKNFKPLPMGTVTLPKGRGQLALKAAIEAQPGAPLLK